jgi:hypothetical protein
MPRRPDAGNRREETTMNDNPMCGDCNRSLRQLRSAPMVHEAVWAACACEPDLMLCDACLRARMRRILGRELRFEDLAACLCNMIDGYHWELALSKEQRLEYEFAILSKHVRGTADE